MGQRDAIARARSTFGPGALLTVIRGSESWTRSELVKASGLGRTAIADRLAQLRDASLITVNDPIMTGGRPAESYSFNANAGRVLVADIGGRHTRMGITDLSGRLIASAEADLDADLGPKHVLGHVCARLQELAHQVGVESSRVWGMGMGVPGPVSAGVMRRPHLPEWEGVDVIALIRETFGDLPVLVDRDAGILARGELAHDPKRCRNAIVLKVGMGVSCAVISDGKVLDGADGAAGDIGHIPRDEGPQCRCGLTGCLDAIASGRAIAQELEGGAHPVRTSRDIVDLVRQNDSEVIRLVRRSGQSLGSVVGFLAAVTNPRVVIVGGNLAESSEPLLAGIREAVYDSYPALLTSMFDIVASTLGVEAGLAGAAQLALDELLSPSSIDAIVG